MMEDKSHAQAEMASIENRAIGRISAECCVNEYACLPPRAFALERFLPRRQADMQPLSHACSETGSSKFLRQSLPPDWNFFEKMNQRGDTSDPRVWASPPLYASTEYDAYFSPNYVHPTYSRTGLFHSGGPASSSVSRFTPVPSERGSMLGYHSQDKISESLPNICARSPAPVTGMCTPITSCPRDPISHSALHVPNSKRQEKQVTLHKWFLVRTSGADTSTNQNVKNMVLSVGGFMRLGSQDSQLVKTSAISERLEKCQLRAIDGTEIFLSGCIDEKSTIANGFSVWVTQFFFTGFPLNWKHLPEISPLIPSDGARTVTSGDSEECEVHSPHKLVDNAISRRLETDELRLSQSKKLVSISPAILFPEISCNEQERLSCQFESGAVISGFDNTELIDANQNHLNQKNKENTLISSPVANQKEPQCRVSDLDELQQSVSRLVRSTGDSEDQKVEGNGEVLADRAQNDTVMHMIPGNEDATTNLEPLMSPVSHGFGTVDDHINQSCRLGAESCDEEKSPVVDCQSGVVTEEVFCPETAITSSGEGENRDNMETHNYVFIPPETHSDNDLSRAEIKTEDSSYEASHLHSPLRPQRKYFTRSRKEEDPENKDVMRLLEAGLNSGHANLKELRRAVKVGCKSSTSTEMKPLKQSEPAGRVEPNKSGRSVKVSPIETRSVQKTQGACHADLEQPGKAGPALKPALTCIRKLKEGRISTRRVSAELACVQASEVSDPPDNCGYHKEPVHSAAPIEANESARKAEEAQEHGKELLYMHSQKVTRSKINEVNPSRRERSKSGFTIRTRQQKNLKLPPPLPPPRADVSKDQVLQAYGLKMSRSGRILVPPLAYWRNQTLAHDMDGRIIAIREGFEEPPSDTGCYNFKPPKERTAIKLQEQLCAAAADLVTPKQSKKRKRNRV